MPRDRGATQWVALGQGFLGMQAQPNLLLGEEHKITRSDAFSRAAKVGLPQQTGGGWQGQYRLKHPYCMSESIFKSSQDFSTRPHSHPSQMHWKSLFSYVCLPPCSSHRCFMTSWHPEPPGQLLWVLAGRKLIPLFVLGKDPGSAGLAWDMAPMLQGAEKQKTGQ